ncbi:hypothetical protein OVA24_03280 [Luteolibacter sp. SL250]|uniref:hypothetical protein n=1 Tax=Luteolibacter sp. SL250 TaxID=2995170 RepID=UPI00226E8877|nr:hypothetical protein [Luteolibacter sp. SL250]WAC20400.1 hypothetical protein OVA24_03280 [Luteolibacter sp. SL250]
MGRTYLIELDHNDLGQLLEGLEMRADSWERTAHYLHCGEFPEDGIFLAEECHRPEEATDIASHYREIISKIRDQMDNQND